MFTIKKDIFVLYYTNLSLNNKNARSILVERAFLSSDIYEFYFRITSLIIASFLTSFELINPNEPLL